MYDIEINGEKGPAWYSDMRAAVDVLDKNVESIYQEINNMGTGWGGSSYEAFKTNAEAQRGYFDSIKDLIDVYNDAILHQFLPAVHDELKPVGIAIANLR